MTSSANERDRPHDLILFDLDGTLSDPLVGTGRSINYTLEHFGFAPIELDRLAPYIGPPIEESLAHLTGVTADADLRAMVTKFLECYSGVGYSENELYPDVAEAIAHLADAGIELGICTAKHADIAERILEMFDLRSYFRFVSGGDFGIPKWRQMAALKTAGRLTPNAVMVGDRATDLIAAHRNGLQSAAVLWGYGSKAELVSERPRYVLHHVGQLNILLG